MKYWHSSDVAPEHSSDVGPRELCHYCANISCVKYLIVSIDSIKYYFKLAFTSTSSTERVVSRIQDELSSLCSLTVP